MDRGTRQLGALEHLDLRAKRRMCIGLARHASRPECILVGGVSALCRMGLGDLAISWKLTG